MAEIITCPSCQSQLQVPENLAGQNVKCPKCGSTFVAGGAAPAAPAPRELAAEPADRPRRERGRGDDYDDDDYDDRDRGRRRRDYQPHRGSTILVLGILSLVVCGVLGPFAWVMGNNDLKEIRAGHMDPEGEGSTNAGRICGMIASILMIVGLVFACIWIIFFAAFVGGVQKGGFR